MSNILFVVKDYCNGANPNAICANHIAEELLNLGVNVFFLSLESGKLCIDNNDCFVIDNDVKKSTFLSTILYPLDNYSIVNKITQKAIALIDDKKIDAVVSFVRPYAAGEALKCIHRKRKNVKTILFEIDSASNRFKYPKTLKEYFLNIKSWIWECGVYKNTDLVINMKSHKNHYQHKIFSRFNIKYVGVPCMQNMINSTEFSVNTVKKTASFVYFGTFYKGLREPYIMMDTLNAVSEIKEISLDIYGNEKNNVFYCDSRFERKYVSINGVVNHSDLLEKIKNFDVLLSIGNKNSDFLPSKTIECICSGKKVIHFYSSDDDVSLPYLMQYPNSLILSENISIQENVKKIIEFLDKPIISISYRELEKQFFDDTPMYSAKTIMTIF